MLPYFRRTTAHYAAVLSPFNQVQMALCGWTNARTVAYVVGVGLGPMQDPGAGRGRGMGRGPGCS